jgi:hypothetical protein
MCNVTLRRVPITIVAMEKKTLSYSECVSVSVVIQNSKRMRHILLSSVACLAVLCYHIIS